MEELNAVGVTAATVMAEVAIPVVPLFVSFPYPTILAEVPEPIVRTVIMSSSSKAMEVPEADDVTAKVAIVGSDVVPPDPKRTVKVDALAALAVQVPFNMTRKKFPMDSEAVPIASFTRIVSVVFIPEVVAVIATPEPMLLPVPPLVTPSGVVLKVREPLTVRLPVLV